jgi:hypothetical protein
MHKPHRMLLTNIFIFKDTKNCKYGLMFKSKLGLTYIQTHTTSWYRPRSQQIHIYAKFVETLEVVLLPSVSNNAILHGLVNCVKCITQICYSKYSEYCLDSITGH